MKEALHPCSDPAAAVAEELADDRDQDDRDDHADDELQPCAAEDQPGDNERRDADQDRDDPAHRVTTWVKQPAEGADDGANYDQPDPVHGASVSRRARPETKSSRPLVGGERPRPRSAGAGRTFGT